MMSTPSMYHQTLLGRVRRRSWKAPQGGSGGTWKEWTSLSELGLAQRMSLGLAPYELELADGTALELPSASSELELADGTALPVGPRTSLGTAERIGVGMAHRKSLASAL